MATDLPRGNEQEVVVAPKGVDDSLVMTLGERERKLQADIAEAVEISRLFFEEAKDLLKKAGLYDSDRHASLDTVVDSSVIIPASNSVIKEVIKVTGHLSPNGTALYIGGDSETMIDQVLISREKPVNPEEVVHEFIHRSQTLSAVRSGRKQLSRQIYETLGFTSEKQDKLRREEADEAKNEVARNVDIARVIVEGLTQWSVRRLNSQKNLFKVNEVAYAPEVMAVNFLNYKLIICADDGLSEDEADAYILDAAITGDLSNIVQIIGKYFPGLLPGIYTNTYLVELYRMTHDGTNQTDISNTGT